MPIRDYELWHGAVITRLCRNDQPVSLTLIETRDGDRMAYWLNDSVVLFIKYATAPKPRKRGGKTTWSFTFQPNHLADIVEYENDAQVYLALVCGNYDLNEKMDICLLYPEDIAECLDLADVDRTQWISVEREPRKYLRVSGPNSEHKLSIPRNRLDTWKIPGR